VLPSFQPEALDHICVLPAAHVIAGPTQHAVSDWFEARGDPGYQPLGLREDRAVPDRSSGELEPTSVRRAYPMRTPSLLATLPSSW
jgi:hypothetical protein